jgi:hypothetical protein
VSDTGGPVAKLVWTRDKPTRPGWYWMRAWEYFDGCSRRRLRTHVVEVARNRDGRLEAILSKVSTFGAITHTIDNDYGREYEWCGPVEVPTGGLKRKALEVRGVDWG